MKNTCQFFFFCVILFTATITRAELVPIKYMATSYGLCKTAMVGTKDMTHDCKPSLLNVSYKARKVMFLFFYGNTFAAFSGDQDRQPRQDYYELDLNQVNFNLSVLPATGKCSMAGDPLVSATYTCEAVIGGTTPETLRFVFESTGKPIFFNNNE
jgi:hypothetical protein